MQRIRVGFVPLQRPQGLRHPISVESGYKFPSLLAALVFGGF